MKRIGPHVSIAGGVENAPVNALGFGASAFGMFTKNQRQWVAKPYGDDTILAFKDALTESGIPPAAVVPHDSYLINLGQPDPDLRRKSLEAFVDELARCRQLGLTMLNFHPGSHVKKVSETECIALIVESLNLAIARVPDVRCVIENTAGQGTNLGYSFEQLAAIIDGVEDKARIGVCIDTCHALAAGYDLRTAEGYDAMWAAFDRIVGRPFLAAMHLNDSKKGLGSRVDRHDKIGDGELGLLPFQLLMADPTLDAIPMILETPNEAGWGEEVKLLQGFCP